MMLAEHFHVVWRVYPYLDLIQMSGLLTGLVTLSRQGVVSLSFERVDRIRGDPYPVFEFTVTQRGSGQTRRVVWELYDRADRISESGLEFADVYFKQQFGPGTDALATPGLAKIRPLGLTVPGYSVGSFRLFVRAIWETLRSRKSPQIGDRGLLAREAFAQVVHWLRFPHPDSAMRRDFDVKQPGVVFQPRLWMKADNGPDPVYDAANSDRIQLVEALRMAFPQEERIGLVHGSAARRLAPGLVLRRRVSMEGHRGQLRRATVAVNCAGLSGSVGWKFAEYLAAGSAIVSPLIETRLPEPVVAGVHYLPYRTPEECVEQCRRLLGDEALSHRMGDVNREYYQRWIHPPAHALGLLRQVFA